MGFVQRDLWTVSTATMRLTRTYSRYPASPSWSPAFESASDGFLLASSGSFRRRVGRQVQFLDVNQAAFRRAGEEVRVAHVTGLPDVSTLVEVDFERLGALDAADWRQGVRPVDARLDLAHRLLLRDVEGGADVLDVEARAIDLVRLGLAGMGGPGPHRLGRRRMERRQLVARVCELLGADLRAGWSLADVAAEVGYSVFHLSHVFREETGTSIGQYRQQLRVRAAIDRLAHGEANLAVLAAELGFADHPHLTRTVKAVAHHTPSQLRRMLAATSTGRA